MSPPKNTNADIWIAGAAAAFTVDLLVFPLDTLKTRLQSPDYRKLYTHATTGAVNRARLFSGLYQGVGSVIVATLPSSGAFFTTYEASKSLLKRINPKTAAGNPIIPIPIVHAASSSIAELVSCAILTPAEVIKQNAQMVLPKSDSASTLTKTSATLKTIRRFRGNPLALWRGYTALASRNLPFTALQFPLFERVRATVRRYRADQRKAQGRGHEKPGLLETGLVTAVSAGSAGSVAAWITTPVDVVKTRIMLDAGRRVAEEAEAMSQATKTGHVTAGEKAKEMLETLKKPATNLSSRQIARDIIAENGVRGLFRGAALRAVWTLLGAGLYLGTYDAGRIYLARRRGEDVDDLRELDGDEQDDGEDEW